MQLFMRKILLSIVMNPTTKNEDIQVKSTKQMTYEITKQPDDAGYPQEGTAILYSARRNSHQAIQLDLKTK
jgi:hypothetical protein